MWVVKLGGSLLADAVLGDWLQVLERHGGGRVVVVPGGGPFADSVRHLQSVHGLSDETVHFLAIDAMEQTARVCRALAPAMQAAGTVEGILSALAAGEVPIWMPGHLLRSEPELPRTWAVTSDSLALWLAIELGAEALFLVKRARLPGQGTDPARLSGLGMLDGCFPRLFPRYRGSVRWLCAGEASVMGDSLRRGSPVGVPLTGIPSGAAKRRVQDVAPTLPGSAPE